MKINPNKMLDDFIYICFLQIFTSNKNKADYYAFVKKIAVSLSIVKKIGEYIG